MVLHFFNLKRVLRINIKKNTKSKDFYMIRIYFFSLYHLVENKY